MADHRPPDSHLKVWVPSRDRRRVALGRHRPTLLVALLLKARTLPVHSRPEDQREDIITLLALVEDPDAMRPSLTQAERRWLRSIESTLVLDDAALPARFSPARLRAARAAYQILVA